MKKADMRERVAQNLKAIKIENKQRADAINKKIPFTNAKIETLFSERRASAI